MRSDVRISAMKKLRYKIPSTMSSEGRLRFMKGRGGPPGPRENTDAGKPTQVRSPQHMFVTNNTEP